MQLDIYRDQALEKLLIVEYGKNIKTLTAEPAAFLKGLTLSRTIDVEFGSIPTGLDLDEVMSAIKERGYFATRHVSTLTEIDEPT